MLSAHATPYSTVTPAEEPGPMGHRRVAEGTHGSRLAPLRGLAGMTDEEARR